MGRGAARFISNEKENKTTMLKLKRYLKPYLGLLAAAVVFLFGQAMLELTLPNYIRDIVFVVLKQGAITLAAPAAIIAPVLAILQTFIS